MGVGIEDMTMTKAISMLSALLFAISASPAFADPPQWAPSLRDHLQKTEGCNVMYMTGVKEFRLLGRDVVEARAHCEDGRDFDARRRDAGSAWETVVCKPVAC
jgi:hypothetical protein